MFIRFNFLIDFNKSFTIFTEKEEELTTEGTENTKKVTEKKLDDCAEQGGIRGSNSLLSSSLLSLLFFSLLFSHFRFPRPPLLR